MEGIVNITKSNEDINRCLAIVKNHVDNLESNVLKDLTIEIMDTSLNIGGDFSDENIENITLQYVQMGGIDRFLNNRNK